jgi:hypothetical protein
LEELLDQARTYLADAKTLASAAASPFDQAKCIAVAKTAQGYGEASGLLLSEII